MDHLIKGQTKWGEHFFSHTQGSHIWYPCPNPHSGNDFCVSFAFA